MQSPRDLCSNRGTSRREHARRRRHTFTRSSLREHLRIVLMVDTFLPRSMHLTLLPVDYPVRTDAWLITAEPLIFNEPVLHDILKRNAIFLTQPCWYITNCSPCNGFSTLNLRLDTGARMVLNLRGFYGQFHCALVFATRSAKVKTLWPLLGCGWPRSRCIATVSNVWFAILNHRDM